MDVFIPKLQYLLASILIIVGFILLAFLLVAAQQVISGEPLQRNNGNYAHNRSIGALGSPNPVTVSVTRMADGFVQTTSSAGDVMISAARSTTSTVTRIAGSVTGGAVRAVVFVAQTPGKIYGAIMMPSASAKVPVIDPIATGTTTVPNNSAIVQRASSTEPQAVMESAWPIHGRITTLFGVPHKPFQLTHTGMDIASGRSSGITAVKPFLPGRVIDTIYSVHGLGNHIIVDHGAGMTSVYAHLYSISVQNGQEVGADTTLGYEGSTGVSTGTHLHFEIRLNGVSVNPQEYVGGQP